MITLFDDGRVVGVCDDGASVMDAVVHILTGAGLDWLSVLSVSDGVAVVDLRYWGTYAFQYRVG